MWSRDGTRTRVERTTATGGEPALGSFLDSFSPVPPWPELSDWPPDVFAVTNLALEQTEAYRFAVAPLSGRRWPPDDDWNEQVVAAAAAWREAAGTGRPPPALVRHHWAVVVAHRDTPLSALRSGQEAALCESLLTLHAIADESCRGLTSGSAADGPMERRAWALLEEHGTLSRTHLGRIRITPKTHFSSRGITTRSMSRYLALNYEAITVGWRRVEPSPMAALDQHRFTLLLLPWPLEVQASDFRPVEGPLDNMDRRSFGFFEFGPSAAIDLDLVDATLAAAARHGERVHAVVLPEDAIDADELPGLEEVLAGRRVIFLVTGVRRAAAGNRLGRNDVCLGVRTRQGWQHFWQAKHHRWFLDESQIRQYHLCRSLDPAKIWWEAIDLPARTVEIVDVGRGVTLAPLVCEDLARLDEVADVLRRIGPTVVLSLLLDGPQLPQRWSCRYASVLADEPGSAVLSLTSLGMAARSTPAGHRRSRAVAMWSEPGCGLRQLDLAPGASGILVTTSVDWRTVWTADGRRHDESTPTVSLTGVEQVRPRARTRRATA
jgi:hypothetical protein